MLVEGNEIGSWLGGRDDFRPGLAAEVRRLRRDRTVVRIEQRGAEVSSYLFRFANASIHSRARSSASAICAGVIF